MCPQHGTKSPEPWVHKYSNINNDNTKILNTDVDDVVVVVVVVVGVEELFLEKLSLIE